MGQPERVVAALAVGACVVGASIALYASSPKVHAAASPAVTRLPAASAGDDPTRAVLGAATRLNAAIERERLETTKGLTAAFASLAQSRANLLAERAQLAGEQLQINAEVQQITARSSQLTAESTTLQREAAALQRRAAGLGSARAGTTPPGQGQPGQGDN